MGPLLFGLWWRAGGMEELTDAQRETLKTLPVSFLTKLRAAVTQKRELDEQMRQEEERVNRLREVVSDWKTKHEKVYDDAMKVLASRLESSQAGVSQAVAHGDKTKQLQLASLDEALARRKQEIERIEVQISERQASIDAVRDEIGDMHVIMEKKRSLIDVMATGGLSARGTGQAMTRRAAMTLYKADGSTQRHDFASLTSPRDGTPRSARDRLIDDMNPAKPTNTPETAESIEKIDIDTVSARVVLESLLELILEPGQVLVQAMASTVRPNEQEKLARCWVEIFASNAEIMDMIRQTITREVANTQELGTLFRSNSMASRVMSIFSRSVGMDYIKSLLKPKIDAIIAANEDLEIDTMKIAGDQIEAQRDHVVVPTHVVDKNVTKLTEHAIDLLQTIMAAKSRAPLEYYQIASVLKELVSQKFPEQWKIAIGGYLFLRLLCPCIFLPPDDFGYNFETVPPESKRTLVLVSKILQNLANLQPKFVEEVMSPFSNFVTFNMHSLAQYFEFMASGPPNTVQPVPLPEYNIRTRLREVLQLAAANQAKLEPALMNAPETFTQLWTFNMAPKLLVVYNKLTIVAGASATLGKLPEDSPDVLAFVDLLAPPTKTIAPIMKLASRDSLVAALPLDHLINPPEDPHVLLAVLETSTRLDFSAVENAELAASLFPLWEYRQRTPELISHCLDVFLRSPTKSNRPLLDSVAAHVFNLWCHRMLANIVKTALSGPVMTLAPKKELIGQREVLLEMATLFHSAIIAALPELLEPLHTVCHRLAASPRFGAPVAAEFILNLIWIKALEDPEKWALPTGGGDRQIKRCLLMISDLLTLVASGQRDKQNAAIDSFLTSSHKKLLDSVTDWIKFATPKKMIIENGYQLSWEEVSPAIDHLRIFVGKNMSSISAILEKTTSESRFVKFTIKEVIAQMTKHAAAKSSK